MNDNLFLKELIMKTEQEYYAFVSFQNELWSILDAVHQVLEKHHIQYYASFGTALGIVRNGGFIPWDYDMDIDVSIQDAQTCVSVLEQDLPDDYYVVSNFTDSQFPYFQTRVCKKGFDHSCHIDIFYDFGLPDSIDEIKKIKEEVLKLFELRYQKYSKFSSPPSSFLKMAYRRFVYFWNKRKCLFLSKEHIDKKIRTILNKYDYLSSTYVVAFNEVFSFQKKSTISCVKKVTVNGHDLYIPEDSIDYLEHCYSHPMEVPPFSTRYREYQQGLRVISNNVSDKEKEFNYRKNIE